jgi:hypothetical protein
MNRLAQKSITNAIGVVAQEAYGRAHSRSTVYPLRRELERR